MMTSSALFSKTNFFTTNLGSVPDTMMLGNSINVNTLAFSFLGDESCSEVSSSSPITSGAQSPPHLLNMGGGFSPPFGTPDINEVPEVPEVTEVSDEPGDNNIDLNFWELAINATSSNQMFGVSVTSTTPGGGARPFSLFTDEGTSPIGREDLSPVSSINSTSLAGEHNDKKKKGSGLRQTEEICLVCGDRASGYHYNALTCEGCKGFFRRSITKDAIYTCKYGQHCEMDMYMRRKCQECRFKKCISVGMRPECVVPEHKCQVKREQKKAREKEKVKLEYTMPIELHSPPQQTLGLLPTFSSVPSTPNSIIQIGLTKKHREIINILTSAQDQYESPLENSIVLPTADDMKSRQEQIIQLTEATFELIAKFSKSVPGFNELKMDDRVIIFKNCLPEVLMLRASRRYHLDTDSIVFANNTPCRRDFYLSAGMDPENIDALFSFCKRMAILKVDNAEYALLSAISLFSERPDLIEEKRVEKIRLIYVETLCAYVIDKWGPKSVIMIGKLLDVLTQLRSLSLLNAVQCEALARGNDRIPQLLLEVYRD